MDCHVELTSTAPVVSVIIPVMNEQRKLRAVIQQAFNVHPQVEVIVVVNGSRDRSAHIARRAGAHVIYFRQALGHDVGRAVGAKQARGDVLLFIDGDMVIHAHLLKRYIEPILNNELDSTLNSYTGRTNRRQVHSVVTAKFALNILLDRADLLGCSMTAVPHALHRRVCEQIGYAALAVPPVAQAKIVRAGWRIAPVQYVNVGKLNARRVSRERVTPLARLIIGDHLEAIQWLSREQKNTLNE